MYDIKRVFAAVLSSALLLFSLPVTVGAKNNELTISTASEWCEFAEQCRLDSFSEGLTVKLASDIDLSDTDSFSVPYFGGSFDGQGHRIYGINTENTQGLFRIVGENGTISNLRCEADIENAQTENSGILCGINKGTISNCSVSGRLNADTAAGGIAGVNEENAVITDCTSAISVQGSSKIGGIVGVNSGLIENCKNVGSVNEEAEESSVYIGGICGYNEGVILGCENTADIGYPHTGYYIGGIAGLSKGYIGECSNSGELNGRRNVGGIAGLMEPHYRLEFGENAMELLSDDTNELISSLNTAVKSLETTADDGVTSVNETVSQIHEFEYWLDLQTAMLMSDTEWIDNTQGYLDEIKDELDSIEIQLPSDQDTKDKVEDIRNILERFDPEKPAEWKTNTQELSDAVSGLIDQLAQYDFLTGSVGSLSQSVYNAVREVTGGFYSFGEKSVITLSNAQERINTIIDNVREAVNGVYDDAAEVNTSVNNALSALEDVKASIDRVLSGKDNEVKDISDEINARESGMTVSCKNSGRVSADYSAAGIVGNISTEIALDREAEPLLTADELLFTDSTTFIRATVYDCFNSADIYAKNNYCGGIVGYGSTGAAEKCQNSGSITAGRSYAGGIAGQFSGSLTACDSIGKIGAESYAGGIAGSCVTVKKCRAVTTIDDSAKAYFGAVSGTVTDTAEGNIFVCEQAGGIDGVSYQGKAEPIEYDELIKQDGTDIFESVTVSFETDDGKLTEVTVPYNGAVTKLPAVAEKEAQYWLWDEFDSEHIRYNMTVGGRWKNMITTLHTNEEKPLFLVEGSFNNTDHLTAVPDDGLKSSTEGALAAYRLSVTGDNNIITVRYLTETDGRLYLQNNGALQEVKYIRDGRYIVFELENGGEFVLTVADEQENNHRVYIICAAVGGVAVVLVTVAAVRKKRNKIS